MHTYTNYFYSVILDIGLQAPENISSLTELTQSSLTTMMAKDMQVLIRINESSDI